MPITAQLLPGVKDPVIPAYNVANSVRYNDGDSPKLNINFGSDGTLNKWTFSMWFKRSTLGTAQRLFCVLDSGMDDYIKFGTDDQLEWTFDNEDGSNKGVLKTNRKFRDVSAWTHLLCRLDTTDGTAGDRMRMYINGTEETSFATDTNPTQNETGDIGRDNNHYIGTSGSSQYFDGYIAEVCMINNQSLAPTSFGEFDSDTPSVFKPIDVSGLTAGTNGFYLDFEDSSSLGNDVSGNNNDFTANNLTAVDQSLDTCTNNFATWNPLFATQNPGTFSEGNCIYTSSTSAWGGTGSTIGLSSGKWYWEGKIKFDNLGGHFFGVLDETVNVNNNPHQRTGTTLFYGASGGQMYKDGSGSGSYGTFSDGDVMGFALNVDDGEISIYKNGSAIVTDFALSTTKNTLFVWGMAYNSGADFVKVNFGGSPPFTISSGNADANGYGNFEYAPPSGYYSICTKNLSEFG